MLKTIATTAFCLTMICGATSLRAADQTPTPAQPKPLTLAIGRITVNPSVIESVQQAGDTMPLRRVIESMEVKLQGTIKDTGKFILVARNKDDLQSVQEEQALISSGLVDKTKPGTAQLGDFTGANFMLETQVTDFQDITKQQVNEGTGTTVKLRTIRMEMSCKIVDTSTTEILQTSEFTLSAKDLQQQLESIESTPGTSSDKLFTQLAGDLSKKVMRDIIYKQFPPRILAKTGDIVTIQISRGTGAKKGEKWDVFALGKNLKDPYTGKDLGPEEIYIGQVELTRVNPDKSQAKAIEDNGIEAGAIARPSETEEKE